MIRERASLSDLQQEVLHTLMNQGTLRRAKGGYAATPGAKAFTVRVVNMLERAGDLVVSTDRRSVTITTQGTQLMLEGRVDLPDAGDGEAVAA